MYMYTSRQMQQKTLNFQQVSTESFNITPQQVLNFTVRIYTLAYF